MACFFIENYGCQMNVSESDSLRGILIENGHNEVHTSKEAEIVIINTCSVRKTAEERVVGRVGYYKSLKESTRKDIKVVLMGCMAQIRGGEIKKKFPDVIDGIWGTYNKDGILDYFNDIEKTKVYLNLSDYRFMESRPQNKFPFKSFVPISHGCNNFCSYCIVPYVRGREIFRSSPDILNNIKKLIDAGVKEVILLGQNVNSYKNGNINFPVLLETIARKTGVERLGFLTSHPKDFTEELVEVIKANPNIMKNIHLPLQSGSNRILELMNRKYTVEEYFRKIEMIREIDDVTISTDIITGFPSETEADFQETLNTVKTIGFQEAFMYHYNRRPGTAADSIQDQVPKDIKLKRLNKLIELQTEITQSKLRSFIGKNFPFLVESESRKNKNELSGRCHNGLMAFIEGKRDLIGKIIEIKLVETRGTGLFGKIEKK